MKYLFIVIAFAGLMLLSCSKTNRSGQDSITGKWELRESSGGFIGTIKYLPGNGQTLQFNKDKTYVFINSSASQVPVTGTYTLIPSLNHNDWILSLWYTCNGQRQTTKDSVRFKGNEFIFLPEASCCDIPTTFYERIN